MPDKKTLDADHILHLQIGKFKSIQKSYSIFNIFTIK
jgi:hypothetical protein